MNATLQAYAEVLRTMHRSGWSTLQILDRQARKDVCKVMQFSIATYRVFTSPNAIKTYRMMGQLMVIAGMVTIALGMTARDWCNAYIDSCLEQPIEPAVESPVELQVEPEPQPQPTPEPIAEVMSIASTSPQDVSIKTDSIDTSRPKRRTKKAKTPTDKRSVAEALAEPAS
ncbi:MAG: hypothetical protein HC781_21600 [Leptolyngbyaceae cyanobacterium CSU_1_4]|nr:hypothetical protein [Leptolyngbyaceae cyanobacterium CSU_1_4]